ncbi:MAG: family 43 glycosylhydrolase [Acutalibacteraceae bacterium]
MIVLYYIHNRKLSESKSNCDSHVIPRSVNPILPLDELIPDVEARVFTDSNGEERVFLYGSHDCFGSKTWCSYQYRVYSSPVTNLTEWTDHGVSFASRKGEGYYWNGKDADGISWNNNRLFAPDVNKIGDTYYLITCSQGGSCLGVATSKNPEGPFSPAKKILYDDGSETSSIDPSLFTEGDGDDRKVYLLWGQRPAFNAKGLLGAELIKDENGLYSIVKKSTQRVLFTGENDEFGFYEGASLRKINDKYYILYPSDHGKGVHTMSYAISDKPLGPYRFGGDILENDGCDLRSGNNHGSFCEINGQWYLFYHRGFGNSDMQRRVCVERIYFDENGKISGKNGGAVVMTNHGFGYALNPFIKTEASYATHVRLEGFKSGCYLTEKRKGLHPLIHITDGNCVEYKDFDFGTDGNELSFSATLLPRKGGKIHIVLDNPSGTPVGTLNVFPKFFKKYVESSANVGAITGIHTLYLRFESDTDEKICDIASFRFFIKSSNDNKRSKTK